MEWSLASLEPAIAAKRPALFDKSVHDHIDFRPRTGWSDNDHVQAIWLNTFDHVTGSDVFATIEEFSSLAWRVFLCRESLQHIGQLLI